LVIDEQSEGHGVTPIDLSTKPGQPQILFHPVLELANCGLSNLANAGLADSMLPIGASALI
jgi:hypothetical protein